MKITDRIHLVGSGQAGFGLTDDSDCHVYLLDGGDACALIDAGGGRDTAGLIARIEADGLDPARVRSLLITHAHADHAAGAAGLRARLGLRVLASPAVARIVRAGDEQASNLAAARAAGRYPADFVYPACPVDEELADGDVVRVGDLSVEVLETPGHAAGHLTYLLRHAGTVSVFTGDTLFFGGRVLLLNSHDASVQQVIRSVERLAALSVDGLYPGHLTFTVRNSRREVEKAMEAIRRLQLPPQLFG